MPCPTTGRVSFDTNDNLGEQLGVLDTTPDPQGGYLGVYQSPVFDRADTTFRVSLARSTDLIHWTRLRVLVAYGASMPTLRPVPGSAGFILAYERAISPADGDQIALRYFPTLSALLSGTFTAQLNLPRLISSYNNGTPTIIWIRWRGGLRRSLIRLGFHYETGDRASRGPDREALGTVIGFRRWTASPDSAPDIALSRQGLSGNHGDFRQFSFANGSWRIYEGQGAFGNFNTWHVLLYSVDLRRLYPLQLTTGTPAQITSVGNPTVTEQPAPSGSGHVLLVTTFVFDATTSGYTGELVYYQPT